MSKAKKKSNLKSQEMLRLSAPQSASIQFTTNNTTYKDCEWCFQFDDEEPNIFAATRPAYEGDEAKISFTLSNQSSTNIIFKDNKTGRQFKLFAREKQL